MIDTFQWFVWPVDSELHEGFGWQAAGADSPQARRLQCLLAEARAAGVPTRVLFGILLDWARQLERLTQADAWHGKLSSAISATDAALYRPGEQAPKSLRFTLTAIEALEAGPDTETPALRAARLLASHALEIVWHDRETKPETAWDCAVSMLAAIADAVDPAELETTMTDCAQQAYVRLFPQCR